VARRFVVTDAENILIPPSPYSNMKRHCFLVLDSCLHFAFTYRHHEVLHLFIGLGKTQRAITKGVTNATHSGTYRHRMNRDVFCRTETLGCNEYVGCLECTVCVLFVHYSMYGYF
jgi:hypothetical protein